MNQQQQQQEQQPAVVVVEPDHLSRAKQAAFIMLIGDALKKIVPKEKQEVVTEWVDDSTKSVLNSRAGDIVPYENTIRAGRKLFGTATLKQGINGAKWDVRTTQVEGDI